MKKKQEREDEPEQPPEVLREVGDACMIRMGSAKKRRVVKVITDEDENGTLVTC